MASETYSLVSSHYTTHASSQSADSAQYNTRVASAFGYSAADLASIPAGANLGMSCGNPLATAGVKEGEVMIDLGSGAGLDVFIASPRVGKTGRAIGVDMTDSMLELSEKHKRRGGYENVEFVKANITSIPLPDSTADIIISNCVVNLVPSKEKPQVFSEIFRLLKLGGRVAISDILARRDIPDEVRSDVGLHVRCVGGASAVSEYEGWMKAARFEDILILDTQKDLNIYKDGILNTARESNGCRPVAADGCCGAPPRGCVDAKVDSGWGERLEKLDLNEYVGAYQIYAVKP